MVVLVHNLVSISTFDDLKEMETTFFLNLLYNDFIIEIIYNLIEIYGIKVDPLIMEVYKTKEMEFFRHFTLSVMELEKIEVFIRMTGLVGGLC